MCMYLCMYVYVCVCMHMYVYVCVCQVLGSVGLYGQNNPHEWPPIALSLRTCCCKNLHRGSDAAPQIGRGWDRSGSTARSAMTKAVHIGSMPTGFGNAPSAVTATGKGN